MTYRKTVSEILKGSDLDKLGVQWELLREGETFVLVLNHENFDNLPETNRLIASTEIIKILKAINSVGIKIAPRAR